MVTSLFKSYIFIADLRLNVVKPCFVSGWLNK